MKYTLIVLFALLCSNSKAQSDTLTTELNKQSIYGTVGTAGFYFTATAYYERLIFKPFEKNNISHSK